MPPANKIRFSDRLRRGQLVKEEATEIGRTEAGDPEQAAVCVRRSE